MASRPRRSNYVKKLANKIPDDKVIRELLLGLELENSDLADYAIVVITASLLELSLKAAILARFRQLEEPEINRLFAFEQDGPLSDFGSRIQIGYALSIFGPETFEDLTSINRIRNSFAHQPVLRSFKTRQIADQC